MSLELLGPHPHVSIQGARTPGKRRFGVPAGGAFDQERWQLCNALVGNLEPAPTLEIAFSKLRARILAPCRVAVSGASLSVDGQEVLGSVLHCVPGQELEVSRPYRARAYLAVAGGWEGTVTNLKQGTTAYKEVHLRTVSTLEPSGDLRVVPFGESPSLDGYGCIVGGLLNRVGIRLEGARVERGRNATSEPTCLGAIQATHEGQLIILGPDGPTVGGYPTQAVVCAADLDALAQLSPGYQVVIKQICRDEALMARKARLASITENLLKIRHIGRLST